MLAPIGPFTDPNEEIFLPFRILQRVNPYLFVYQNPKKVPQFGADPTRLFIPSEISASLKSLFSLLFFFIYVYIFLLV